MNYYIEKGSGYEFGIEGENIFIVKSPKKSSTSRDNPQKVKNGSKAYNAIKKFIDNQKSKSDVKDTVQTDKEQQVKTVPVKQTKKEKVLDTSKLKLKKFSDFKEVTWLSGEHDYIEAVRINGKDYFSYGYAEDVDTGRKGIAVKMTYLDSRDLNNSSGKFIGPVLQSINVIKPKLGTYNVPFKKGKNIKNVYIVPWETKGVELLVDSQDFLDGATIAAKIQTIGDVVAGIPIVGFIGDFGNCIVELLKPVRSYFNAALYAIGAIPFISEGLVILRATNAIPKIAAKAGAKEGALKLAQSMNRESVSGLQKIGSALRGKTLTQRIVQFEKEFIDFFRNNISSLEAIGVKLGDDAIEGFIKYFQEFCVLFRKFKDLSVIKTLSAYKDFLALARRPLAAATQEINRTLLDKIITLNLYDYTGVKRTDNAFDDLVKINDVIMTKIETGEVTEDLANAQIKMMAYLENEFQNTLNSQNLAESLIISDDELRKMIRQIIY
jgi:hypothetical protein